jgi:metal-responsive CopG/Arc/MetJ family transcriptional regulator
VETEPKKDMERLAIFLHSSQIDRLDELAKERAIKSGKRHGSRSGMIRKIVAEYLRAHTDQANQ